MAYGVRCARAATIRAIRITATTEGEAYRYVNAGMTSCSFCETWVIDLPLNTRLIGLTQMETTNRVTVDGQQEASSKEILGDHRSIVLRENTPSNMLAVIAAAVSNPLIDVAKMQALLDMHLQITAQQQKVAFMEAMARLQAVMPQMEKYGQAKNSKFAKLEDIDVVIRPLLSAEGFSFSFDEEAHTESTITFIALLSHSGGHSEAKRLTVPIDRASKNRDGNAIRPAIQDAGSTVSYARRYLIKMHLNIIEKNEDTDGNSTAAISADQVIELRDLITETKADEKKFLELIAGVSSLEMIPSRDYTRVKNALETKKRAQK